MTPEQLRDTLMQMYPGRVVFVSHEANHFVDPDTSETLWSGSVSQGDGYLAMKGGSAAQVLDMFKGMIQCRLDGPVTAAERAVLNG